MMVYLAGALALHLVPVLAVDPESDTVDVDEGPTICGSGCECHHHLDERHDEVVDGRPVLLHREIWEVGPRDPTLVRRYLQRQARALAQCGDRELEGETEVEVRFDIRADGRVDRTRVRLDDRETAACVERVLSAITFPPIDDPTRSEAVYRFAINREALRYGMTVAEAGVFVR